jgi:carboxyl-terminal processing protease
MKEICLGFTILAVSILPPSALPAEDAPLAPTTEMGDQTRWVVNTINNRHYLRDTIGKLDGKKIIEAYIKSFDYGQMHFLQSDLDEFYFRFADAMEAFLQKGNLYAAFEIFKTFRERIETRTDWIHARLKEDFGFSVEESFVTDRKEAPWPADTSEADALWERRIKYELINEMLSLASESKLDKLDSIELQQMNPGMAADEDDSEEDFDPETVLRLLEDPEYYADILEQAKTKIRRRYDRRLGRIKQREAAEVQEAYVNSMTQLFDPHSSFLSADTLENFNSAVQNSFVGIGALLQDEDGICTIKDILPGGPAEASRKLGAGDEIRGVAQGKDGEFEDIVDMQLRYIVRKIKGKKGTVVRLLIHPADTDPSARKEVSIVRDEVKLTANLATAQLIEVPNESGTPSKIGVIHLPSFYGNIGMGDNLTTTSADIAELLNKLQSSGAEGLVLDLRNNGGGLLSEAVRVAGLFIPTGPVVQVRDKSGRIDVLPDNDPRIVWRGPLIVLTSRFSASASEIVAGALRDHGRALVIGNSSTHGKGTVQEVYHMNNRPVFSFLPQFSKPTSTARPVASKITIKQFYLPGGTSTQLEGVPSDIILPSSNEFLPIGESDLPHALPWNQIDPLVTELDWSSLGVSGANDPLLIEALEQASMARQTSLEEFDFLSKQIAWRKKRFEEKAVSIHLAQRITDKIEDEAYAEQLNTAYEALREKNYPTEEFLTKISEEQEALSIQNLSLEIKMEESPVETEQAEAISDPDPSEADSEEEEEESFDIYLRETARIMADWVQGIAKEPVSKITASVE